MQAQTCSKCKNTFLPPSQLPVGNLNRTNQSLAKMQLRYCCDPSQHFCMSCADTICRQCNKKRTNIKDFPTIQPIIPSKIPAKKRCLNCFQKQIPLKHTFYFDKTCNAYYCHQCVIIFYHVYWQNMKNFERLTGDIPPNQVVLKCGCQVLAQSIIEYVQKYCFGCSWSIKEKGILLKNKCKITLQCIKRIRIAGFAYNGDLQINQEAKKTWKNLESLMISCSSCKGYFDESKLTIVERLGNSYFCNLCYPALKRAFQFKSNHEQMNIFLQATDKGYQSFSNSIKMQNSYQEDKKILSQKSKWTLSQQSHNFQLKKFVYRPWEQKAQLSKTEKDIIDDEQGQSGIQYLLKKMKICQDIQNKTRKQKDASEFAICKQNSRKQNVQNNYSKFISFPQTNQDFQVSPAIHLEKKQPILELSRPKPQAEFDHTSEKYNKYECKICFNGESTMINKTCRHMMMCQKCYEQIRRKSKSDFIKCPLCQTSGKYVEYVVPILS